MNNKAYKYKTILAVFCIGGAIAVRLIRPTKPRPAPAVLLFMALLGTAGCLGSDDPFPSAAIPDPQGNQQVNATHYVVDEEGSFLAGACVFWPPVTLPADGYCMNINGNVIIYVVEFEGEPLTGQAKLQWNATSSLSERLTFTVSVASPTDGGLEWTTLFDQSGPSPIEWQDDLSDKLEPGEYVHLWVRYDRIIEDPLFVEFGGINQSFHMTGEFSYIE